MELRSVRQQYAVDGAPSHATATLRRPSPVMTGRVGMIAALQAQAGNRAVAALLSRSAPVQRCGGQPCEGCDKDTDKVQRVTVQRDAAVAEKVRNSVSGAIQVKGSRALARMLPTWSMSPLKHRCVPTEHHPAPAPASTIACDAKRC